MAITIPNKQYVASFDVDAQNTFTPVCPEELPVPDGHLIVSELNLQAKKAGFRIGSKDAHSPHALWVAKEKEQHLKPIIGENIDVHWPIHAVPGSKGFELIHGLPKITQYDFFVWKGVELDMHPYGACFHDFAEKLSTGVIEFLKSKQIQTVIVGGLATDYCVKTTVLQLLNSHFKVIVNLGACRGIADSSVKQAIEAMKQAGAVFVTSANELINEME